MVHEEAPPDRSRSHEALRLEAEVKRLEQLNARLAKITAIVQELGQEIELEALLPLVIAKVTQAMEADRSSLFLYDRATEELWTMVGEGLEINEIRMPVSAGIVGRVATTGQSLNVADAYALPFYDRSWDQKTGYRTKSVLCVPLRNNKGKILGALEVLNKKDEGVFTGEDADFLTTLAGQIAVHVENAGLYHQIENLFQSVVDAIAIAIDERDPVTAGHSRRVTEFTIRMAQAMHWAREGPFREVRFSRSQLKELRYACLLHDFGKVSVPEAVLQKAERLPMNWIHVIRERLGRRFAEERLDLCRHGRLIDSADPQGNRRLDERVDFLVKLNAASFLTEEAADRLQKIFTEGWITDWEYRYLSIKKGTLTPEERKIVESHVEKTYSVLSAISWPDDMRNVPNIAASHHEAMDGRGYPHGLAGDEIPLAGRIMAVADVYDALTALDRPYKPAIPHEASADILREMARKGQLDPDIVEFFLREEIYRLTGGDTA
ncbi:MAG: HD domain-containing phosphohydrolase [Planctomycetota bacterium]